MNNEVTYNTLFDFYNAIKVHEQVVYSCPFLSKFKDYMDAAFQGCACKKQANINKALEVYKALNSSIDQRVLDSLKVALNTNKIYLFHDSTPLFVL